MFESTHSYPNLDAKSDMLDFHRIDPDTLGEAIGNLNKIVDKHARLLRHDTSLARGVLRYENLLVDAQSGDSHALKLATSPDEFDKVLELAEEKPEASAPRDALDGEAELNYLELRKDLLSFRHYYLSASHAD